MLSKDDIERGLLKLGELASKNNRVIDISIYGGSALALAWNSRVSTKDVDAVVHGDPAFIREACQKISAEEGWPEDWLNDGVKGFLSNASELELHQTFPSIESPGLRVFVPTLEYMLALKCMAMRVDGAESSHDLEDIKFLIREGKMETVNDVLDIVEKFYPRHHIPPKVIDAGIDQETYWYV
jgi:predicted nucleotidyltransferase